MSDETVLLLAVGAFGLWYFTRPREISPMAPGFTQPVPPAMPLIQYGETSIAGSQSGFLDNTRLVDSGQGTSWNGDQGSYSGMGPETPYVAPVQPRGAAPVEAPPTPQATPPAMGMPGDTRSPFPTKGPSPFNPARLAPSLASRVGAIKQ